jgi:hypothetical protein
VDRSQAGAARARAPWNANLSHPAPPPPSLSLPRCQTCSLKWNADINNPIIFEEGSGDWLAATTANGFQRQGY